MPRPHAPRPSPEGEIEIWCAAAALNTNHLIDQEVQWG
jgi:hypothetical protein